MRAIPRRGIQKWDFLLQCTFKKKKKKKIPDCRAGDHARYLVPRPFLAACAIPRRGIHKWDFCCSVHKKKFLIAGLEIMPGTWFHDLSWQRAISRRGIINGIVVEVYIKKNQILIAGLGDHARKKIARRGIHQWDFCCSVN
jgi:hypothetical protein